MSLIGNKCFTHETPKNVNLLIINYLSVRACFGAFGFVSVCSGTFRAAFGPCSGAGFSVSQGKRTGEFNAF